MKRDSLALAFAMLFPAAMAWLYLVVLAAQGEERNLGLIVPFAAGKLLQFSFPLVYVWRFDRERLPSRARQAAPSTRRGLLTIAAQRGLVWGGLFGLGTAAAILGVYFAWLKPVLLDTSAPRNIRDKLQEFGLASPGGFILLAAFMSVAHALLEEYYWRWFVFGTLRKHLALPAALALSSLAFMAHHVIVLCVYFPGQIWAMAIPFSVAVAFGGAMWAWIYDRTGSLAGPWLSHLLTDAAIMIVGYDMVFA